MIPVRKTSDVKEPIMKREICIFSYLLFFSVSSIHVSYAENEQSGIIPPVSFTRSSQVFDAVNTYQIVLGDLDTDRDLDAVFSSYYHGRVL